MRNQQKQTSCVRLSIYLGIVMSIALLTSSCGAAAPVLEEDPAFQSALKTAVEETVAAAELDLQRTKGAEAALSPTNTPRDTETATLEPTSTLIPTMTSSPTSAPEEESAAGENEEPTQTGEYSAQGPVVQVSVDTNCRTGPGKSYKYVGGLFVGDQAVVAGKDPSGEYWYITNPDQEDGFCWIWGKYAQLTGSTSPLPVYTPGPTPKPDLNFSTAFHQVENCGGNWQIEFEIVNNGLVTLESIAVSVTDSVTGVSAVKNESNDFEAYSGCSLVSSRGRIHPEAQGYAVSLDLPADPTGHELSATLKVCNEDNLYGDCRSRTFYFTP